MDVEEATDNKVEMYIELPEHAVACTEYIRRWGSLSSHVSPNNCTFFVAARSANVICSGTRARNFTSRCFGAVGGTENALNAGIGGVLLLHEFSGGGSAEVAVLRSREA